MKLTSREFKKLNELTDDMIDRRTDLNGEAKNLLKDLGMGNHNEPELQGIDFSLLRAVQQTLTDYNSSDDGAGPRRGKIDSPMRLDSVLPNTCHC